MVLCFVVGILGCWLFWHRPLPMMRECGLRNSSRRRPLALGLVVRACGFGWLVFEFAVGGRPLVGGIGRASELDDLREQFLSNY